MDEHSMGQATEGLQAVQFARLPAEMKAYPQWAVAGASKAPLSADGGGKLHNASISKPGDWLTFQRALELVEKHQGLVTTHTDKKGQTFSQTGLNIGFVFTAADPFACIDLDVKDDTPPEQIERYQSIVSHFDSYAEVSRSGRGTHILLRANIGPGRKRDGIEVYSQERFLICTGNVSLNKPLADRQEMLANMVSQMPKKETTDRALTGDPSTNWTLADTATQHEGELGKLFRGDWQGRYPSQSEADLALVKLLLPECDSPRECWETFLLSGLAKRDKAKRSGYARSTVGLAIEHVENDAEAVQHGRTLAEAMRLTHAQALQRGFMWPLPTHNPAHFRLLSDDDLARMPKLRWLVKGIVPDKGIGTIYGQSKTYKSFLTLDLLAHIANGQPWFGKKVIASPAVYVPFEGVGGVPNRVDAWRRAHRSQASTNMRFITDPMNLRQKADRDKLVETLTASGWAGGVLCIDTLAQAGIGIDENTSQGMGEMIGIFQELQQRLGGVVLVVHHSGKSEKAGMRGHSSLQGALDFAVHCWRDDEWPKYDGQFVLDKVKEGQDELWFNFKMEPFVLGEDEDGEPIISLTLHPTPDETAATPSESAIAAADDAFVDAWIRRVTIAGTLPTGRWLESQMVHVKAERNLTQKRLRDAIARLKGVGKLEDTPGGPSGAKWLRAVDVMPARGQ